MRYIRPIVIVSLFPVHNKLQSRRGRAVIIHYRPIKILLFIVLYDVVGVGMVLWVCSKLNDIHTMLIQ